MAEIVFETEPELQVVIKMSLAEANDLIETLGYRFIPQPNQLYKDLLKKQEDGEFNA